jgi:hypothetical protein
MTHVVHCSAARYIVKCAAARLALKKALLPLGHLGRAEYEAATRRLVLWRCSDTDLDLIEITTSARLPARYNGIA